MRHRAHATHIVMVSASIHLDPGALELFVVNALSERFELSTVRDDQR
jgi:metal-responsive CopG/Arc/MetJ family transcriptional regulator